jgi:hypothetical protein
MDKQTHESGECRVQVAGCHAAYSVMLRVLPCQESAATDVREMWLEPDIDYLNRWRRSIWSGLVLVGARPSTPFLLSNNDVIASRVSHSSHTVCMCTCQTVGATRWFHLWLCPACWCWAGGWGLPWLVALRAALRAERVWTRELAKEPLNFCCFVLERSTRRKFPYVVLVNLCRDASARLAQHRKPQRATNIPMHTAQSHMLCVAGSPID